MYEPILFNSLHMVVVKGFKPPDIFRLEKKFTTNFCIFIINNLQFIFKNILKPPPKMIPEYVLDTSFS